MFSDVKTLGIIRKNLSHFLDSQQPYRRKSALPLRATFEVAYFSILFSNNIYLFLVYFTFNLFLKL